MKFCIIISLFLAAFLGEIHAGTIAEGMTAADSVRLKIFIRGDADTDIIESPSDNNASKNARSVPWSNYEQGALSTMAILITDPNCDWLPLAHGMKTIGVPFMITSDFSIALKHNVVMLFPGLSPSMQTKDFFSLRDFVRDGGTLIGMQANGSGLGDVFGYEDSQDVTNQNYVEFVKTKFKLDELKYDYDKKIVIRNPQSEDQTMGAVSYTGVTAKQIAQYEDGSPAILENKYGKGKAYAVGIEMGNFLSIGYNGCQDLMRSYVNHYEPTLDIMLRLIREFYREAGGITLGTCPDGKHLSVMFTHDIDFTGSVKNSLVYANFEKQSNITATYFMQTKYIKDWEDSAFFTAPNVKILKQIRDMNMEIASHSVSHSQVYRDCDIGDGEETVSSYKPFVLEAKKLRGGSVFGEIRVSKELLDSLVGVDCVSFRPGHLSFPKALSHCLAVSGYKYSSSVTANDALTHLPFQLSRDRKDITEEPVFEFPITVEDEEGIMGDRVNEAIELADMISHEDGLMLILIHPNILGHKLQFEKTFYAAEADKAWFGSVKEFGNWWSARNDVKVEYNESKIILDCPRALKGLTLQLPNGNTILLDLPQGRHEINYHGTLLATTATGL